MTGRKNWVQKLLNDQTEKICNNPKVLCHAIQIQTQIMTERGNPFFCRDTSHAQRARRSCETELTGKPFVCRDVSHTQGVPQTRSSHDNTNFNVEDKTNHDKRKNQLIVVTQITHKMFPKHVLLMKARTSTLKMKQIMMERRNPWFSVTQVTSNVTRNQC